MEEEPKEDETDDEPLADPPSLELISLLPDPQDMPLKECLRRMGVFCVQMHNDLHPADISKIAPLFCSPKFHVEAGHPEHYMLATSMSEYLSNVKHFRKTNPHYWTQATNLTVDVDEDEGEAVLIATMETHVLMGASDDLVRQNVYMRHWRRVKNGRWCVRLLEIIRRSDPEPTF